MNVSRREFDSLMREVDRLRQELAKRPVRHPAGGAAATAKSITVIGGNTLADGVTLGVKFTSTIASVPSAYDPTVTSAFIDGIGRGTLYVDGVSRGNVLIVNDGRTGAGMSVALYAGDRIGTVVESQILIAGDPNGATVTCYVPYWL